MIEHNPMHSRQSFICAPFQLHFNQHLTLLKIKSIIKLHRQSEFWQMKAKKSKNWRYFCSQASIKILHYVLLVPNDLFVLNGSLFLFFSFSLLRLLPCIINTLMCDSIYFLLVGIHFFRNSCLLYIWV